MPAMMPILEKCYYPFLIALAFLFGTSPFLFVLGLTMSIGSQNDDVGILHVLGLLAALPLATCNVIAARDNRFGTKPLDVVLLVLAVAGLTPLTVLTSMVGCAIAILAIVKYFRHQRAQAPDALPET
jgi:hypothetical protein